MSNSKLDELWFRYVKGEKLTKAEVQAACEADPPGVKDFIRRLVVGEPMSDFDPPTAEDLAENRRKDEEFIRQQQVRRERESHVAVYLLSEHHLIDALRGLFVLEGLPADAEFGGVYYDWNWRAFSVRIISESFPAVPDGELTPKIPEQQYETITHTTIKDIDGKEWNYHLTERQKVEATPNGIRFREFI